MVKAHNQVRRVPSRKTRSSQYWQRITDRCDANITANTCPSSGQLPTAPSSSCSSAIDTHCEESVSVHRDDHATVEAPIMDVLSPGIDEKHSTLHSGVSGIYSPPSSPSASQPCIEQGVPSLAAAKEATTPPTSSPTNSPKVEALLPAAQSPTSPSCFLQRIQCVLPDLVPVLIGAPHETNMAAPNEDLSNDLDFNCQEYAARRHLILQTINNNCSSMTTFIARHSATAAEGQPFPASEQGTIPFTLTPRVLLRHYVELLIDVERDNCSQDTSPVGEGGDELSLAASSSQHSRSSHTARSYAEDKEGRQLSPHYNLIDSLANAVHADVRRMQRELSVTVLKLRATISGLVCQSTEPTAEECEQRLQRLVWRAVELPFFIKGLSCVVAAGSFIDAVVRPVVDIPVVHADTNPVVQSQELSARSSCSSQGSQYQQQRVSCRSRLLVKALLNGDDHCGAILLQQRPSQLDNLIPQAAAILHVLGNEPCDGDNASVGQQWCFVQDDEHHSRPPADAPIEG